MSVNAATNARLPDVLRSPRMNVFTAPALLGAGLVSAPAFWGVFVTGTTQSQTALLRFVVAAALAWAALNALALVVGPTPGDTGATPEAPDDRDNVVTAFDETAVESAVEQTG
jgi:hypothetical protein